MIEPIPIATAAACIISRLRCRPPWPGCATTERNRAASLEQHAGPRDHDQDERRRREAEETIRRNHHGSLRLA
jgi:hypothetical protein